MQPGAAFAAWCSCADSLSQSAQNALQDAQEKINAWIVAPVFDNLTRTSDRGAVPPKRARNRTVA